MPMKVRVVEYNPNWPDMFAEEAANLARVLGKHVVAIHHIGSTSVVGLKAKPIIDILPIVTDITIVDKLKPKIEALGYEGLGENGLPGRRYFRKGGDSRTHQVHIYGVENKTEIERHLAFRDYLRAHPKIAHEYGELKSRLALLYAEDIESYMNGKDAFVKSVERLALAWYYSEPLPE
jgi:GrpB-like predicted nucleotidyltransferase (UPF0157 family)